MTGENWKVIDTYTRKQAIADGVLVDVTGLTDRNGKKISPFKYPVVWWEQFSLQR